MTLRGYQVAPGASSVAVGEAVNQGAKLIRYQILSPVSDLSLWLDESLEQTRKLFREVYNAFPGVTFILDLHRVPAETPAGITTLVKRYWTDALKIIPPRPTRLILDVLNEPAITVSANTALMREMVTFIRASRRSIPISVTSAYGDPTNFSRIPFFDNDPNIYYQFHYYAPMNFTHQGVHNYPTGKVYPTAQNDSKRMRQYLDRVYNFRQKYPNAHILCGEFSCVDFTDPVSRAKWTRDVVIHLQRLKAHWCWHAWREWQHWQPEGETLRVLTNNMRK